MLIGCTHLNIAESAVEVQQKAKAPMQLEIIGLAMPSRGIAGRQAILNRRVC